MSNGTLSKLLSVANTFALAYSTPANLVIGTYNLEVTNTSNIDIIMRIAISADATPTIPLDLVEHRVVIPANGGGYKYTCFLLGANEKLFVNCDSALAVIRVSGAEQLPNP